MALPVDFLNHSAAISPITQQYVTALWFSDVKGQKIIQPFSSSNYSRYVLMSSFWRAKTKACLTRISACFSWTFCFYSKTGDPPLLYREEGAALEESVAAGSWGTVRLLSHSPQRTAIFCLSYFSLPSLKKFIKELGKSMRMNALHFGESGRSWKMHALGWVWETVPNLFDSPVNSRT